MLRTILATLVLSALSSAVAQCAFTEARSTQASLQDIAAVRVISPAGALAIRGVADAEDVITVDGRACASQRGMLEDVHIVTDVRGDVLVITGVVPDLRFLQRASIDLDIRLPESIPVEVEDGSGDVVIERVASLRLEDGSGDVSARTVFGPVVVSDDGSGDMRFEDVAGDVTIQDDGTGDMTFARIDGDLAIEDDGSGNISATDVTGSVSIAQDGSGNIDLREIGGDVLVVDDGSGDIVVEGVGGTFAVRSDGSGSIRYRDVSGAVDVPRD